MPGLARPVRIDARSSRATATAFSIFSSASKRVSSITVPSSVSLLASANSRGDQCSDLLTCDGPGDIAVGKQVEDEDRHTVVHAEAEGGGVRDPKSAVDDLPVGDLGEQLGVGVVARVVGED